MAEIRREWSQSLVFTIIMYNDFLMALKKEKKSLGFRHELRVLG